MVTPSSNRSLWAPVSVASLRHVPRTAASWGFGRAQWMDRSSNQVRRLGYQTSVGSLRDRSAHPQGHAGRPVSRPIAAEFMNGLLGCLRTVVGQAEDLRGVCAHVHLADLAGHDHREAVDDVDVAGHFVVREPTLAERANALCI